MESTSSMIRSKLKMAFLWALLTLALHVWPGIVAPVHAQGSRKDDIVFNSRGIPLAGATVRICAMPASGQPCTPLAQIYSDPGLTQALANPTTTDGLGNYFFYAAPGKYEIEVSGPGITTKQLPNVILPNDPSSPTFSTVSSSGAISAFSLNLTGNLSVNGSTSVLGNLASGTLNLTNQSTPPGAAGSGTVNLYTKTADKKLYYKDDTGAEQGPLGAGAQTNAINTFTAAQNFDADIHAKGPNPWFDLARYGGYSVSGTPPSTTGSINASSSTLTIANAQDFANGQGIVVYQAGAAPTLNAPGVPTVTPTNITGSGGVAGSTNYAYRLVAEDRQGGLTAAGTAGSTSVGVSTLGANTINLTNCTIANGVATYTSSVNHLLQVGAQVGITGFTGGVFTYCNGVMTVASTPTGTTFTTVIGPANILNNTSITASGIATVIACNTLTLANGSMSGNNTLRYWVYRSTNSGAYSIVGVALGLDPWFQDCGQGGPSVPTYVPSTPPGSAQNEYLATTITSGGGTTTLTLATAASNSVTSQPVLHDNSANLKAAMTAASNNGGGTVFIPNGGSASWPFNASTDVTSGVFTNPVRIHINGGVNLAQPWIVKGGLDIEGEPHASTSFQYVNTSGISGNANPLIYWAAETGTGLHLKQLLLSGGGNQQTSLLSDEGGDGGSNVGLQAEDLNVLTGAYGPGVVLKGGFDFFFDRGTCFSNNNLIYTGGSCIRLTNSSTAVVTPSTPGQISGSVRMNQWYMAGNAIQIDCLPNSTASAASRFELRNDLFESAAAPFLRVNCPTWDFAQFYMVNVATADVVVGIGTPFVDARAAQMGETYCEGCQAGTGGVPFLISTGALGDLAVLVNTSGLTNPGNTTYTYQDSGLGTNGNVSASMLEFPMAIPAAPTAVVAAGGSWSIGTFPVTVQFLDANGNASTVSPSVTVTTSSGNQTVNITRPTPPSGAVSWFPYINGARAQIASCNVPLPISTVTFSQTAGFLCGNSTISPSAAASAMGGNGVLTPTLTVVDPNKSGFTAQTNFPNALTANRTWYVPDATGYIPVTSYLNSGYDNFNRANGAIGGNWTVSQNSLNVTSNTIQGGSGGAHNTAYWTASGQSQFAPSQFSEGTITAFNGTSDFPGVTVLFSGSGGTTQGYMCFEDTTQILLQKMSAGSGSVLTSASTTGNVGDVLRLEVVEPGGTLTCYKNGVSTLTATDTSFASGSPGLDLFGNVATMDNWSGGNLHPLAHLDREQDWTQPQHFSQGLAISGEPVSASPRGEQNIFLPGALTSTWTGSTWTLDKGVTVTRMQVQTKTAPSGCSTNAVVRLTDGTTPVNLTISAAASDTGAIAQNYAAGATLTVSVQTAAAGCTTSPADANVSVQYRMQ
jgi:hypothetical protein